MLFYFSTKRCFDLIMLELCCPTSIYSYNFLCFFLLINKNLQPKITINWKKTFKGLMSLHQVWLWFAGTNRLAQGRNDFHSNITAWACPPRCVLDRSVHQPTHRTVVNVAHLSFISLGGHAHLWCQSDDMNIILTCAKWFVPANQTHTWCHDTRQKKKKLVPPGACDTWGSRRPSVRMRLFTRYAIVSIHLYTVGC